MKLIDQVRDADDLSSFGTLLRFNALIYDSENEEEEDCEANSPFEPNNIDCTVVFPLDRRSADITFDLWVEKLKAAQMQFLDDGEEEGFVALFDTPKGLMILAGTNLMGYEGPDLDDHLPGAKKYIGMPHATWERILADVFGEQ